MPDAIEFAHVTISSKVCSTAAARQAATPMFLPGMFAVYAVSSSLLINPVLAGFAVGVVAWLLAAIRLVMGSRSLNRERLLGFGGAV